MKSETTDCRIDTTDIYELRKIVEFKKEMMDMLNKHDEVSKKATGELKLVRTLITKLLNKSEACKETRSREIEKEKYGKY